MDFAAGIQHEHENIRRLLGRLAKAAQEVVERTKLFAELKATIVPHMIAEERTLYPALMATDGLRYTVLVLFEEHHFIQVILDELGVIPGTSDQWNAKQQVLREFLLEHLAKEEKQLLGRFSSFSPDGIEELSRRFRSSEEQIRRELGIRD